MLQQLSICILYAKIDYKVFILVCSVNLFYCFIFGFLNEKTG